MYIFLAQIINLSNIFVKHLSLLNQIFILRRSLSYIHKNLNILILGLFISGCTLEKESGLNRRMQNLTAHYNILFNANDLLNQKQEARAAQYIDAYNQILSVYQDTATKSTTADKDLEAAINKANNIISIKEQSHYIGDAYMVLGKANYLEANYYNAIEFFSYVARSYSKQKSLAQDALTWKARALMQIDQLPLAKITLDTALLNIFPKQKNIADVYATLLQYDIYKEKYIDAEEMAKKAIHYTHDKNHRLRWTFILAQLQEINNKPNDAYLNYTKIVNSNAAFEMAFNASLNRVRIEDTHNGVKLSRIDRLRSLLKDDKNSDFIDQIYFQIGEQYLAQNNIEDALKNYALAIRKSTKNQNQKGLSYLRIADIDFKNKADYAGAKNYYDSTLTALSTNYPGYQNILKKSNNLQLLANSLQIIANEDTLQMLAKLDEKTRTIKVNEMVRLKMAQQKALSLSSTGKAGNFINTQTGSVSNTVNNTNSTFYFNNVSAVSQGFTDFKRVWGNRQLADNWRRSVKSNSETNNPQVATTIQNLQSTAAGNQLQNKSIDPAETKARLDIVQNIPLTQAGLLQSNMHIYNAYVDIADFYRDILNDHKEAIVNFELILTRFSNSPNKAAIYYNLYRLYSDIDHIKSEKYKNLILKDYPESNFAKVIIDPDFNQKLNDKNAEFTAIYNQLFDLVSHKKYTKAATVSDSLIHIYPNNSFIAQVYYLRAIALGHTQKLAPFRTELQEIADKFQEDRLITPLVKQHLDFIKNNEADIAQRRYALLDSDPNEVPFMQEKFTYKSPTYYNPANFAKPQPPIKQPIAQARPAVITPAITAINPAIKPVEVNKEAPSIFSLRDSANYYFVINVNTNTINLAPSRFGIGQFNRGNFQGNSIKHQLKPIGNNQLIYVGMFNNLKDVKGYARAIAPLLPDIMKVPADKYTFFIITKENLDKLADKKTLDSYFDFYQKKY